MSYSQPLNVFITYIFLFPNETLQSSTINKFVQICYLNGKITTTFKNNLYPFPKPEKLPNPTGFTLGYKYRTPFTIEQVSCI